MGQEEGSTISTRHKISSDVRSTMTPLHLVVLFVVFLCRHGWRKTPRAFVRDVANDRGVCVGVKGGIIGEYMF